MEVVLKNGNCGIKHSDSIDASCAELTEHDGNVAYRCDRPPHKSGNHHVCGYDWKVSW